MTNNTLLFLNIVVISFQDKEYSLELFDGLFEKYWGDLFVSVNFRRRLDLGFESIEIPIHLDVPISELNV